MLAVIGLSFVWLFLGALNVWLLLRCLWQIELSSFLKAYLYGWAASLILPSQLGDASQVLVLRQQGVPAASASAAYLLDKAISLGWMVSVSAYGVGLFTVPIRGWWLFAFAGLAVGLMASAIAIFLRVRVETGGIVARAQSLLSRVVEQSLAFRHQRGAVARNISLTILKWALTALLFWCAFRAFGVEIDAVAAGTIPFMSSLVGYIPVTVGGAGTTEWTAVALFAAVGVKGVSVVSVYLLARATLVAAGMSLLALAGKGTNRGADK